jgi:hypothetical protein
MVLAMSPELEAALNELAIRRGVRPEDVALDVLRDQLLANKTTKESQDEWVRRLRGIAIDCGVALSDEAISSEGLYD